MASDWKKLHRVLTKQGCELIIGGSGHYKIYHQGKIHCRATQLPQRQARMAQQAH